jgi:hypothetical protein
VLAGGRARGGRVDYQRVGENGLVPVDPEAEARRRAEGVARRPLSPEAAARQDMREARENFPRFRLAMAGAFELDRPELAARISAQIPPFRAYTSAPRDRRHRSKSPACRCDAAGCLRLKISMLPAHDGGPHEDAC